MRLTVAAGFVLIVGVVAGVLRLQAKTSTASNSMATTQSALESIRQVDVQESRSSDRENWGNRQSVTHGKIGHELNTGGSFNGGSFTGGFCGGLGALGGQGMPAEPNIMNPDRRQ